MSYPIAEFVRDIGDIEHSTVTAIIRSKSRDRYGVSPLLREMLKGKIARGGRGGDAGAHTCAGGHTG